MDGKQADEIFESLLEATGGLTDINQAINKNDHAQIVRAATTALRKTFSIPMILCEKKSAEVSNSFRKQGNLYYLKKDFKEAIECFNKALAYAPIGSLELKLAYSNLSAVMLSIKAFQACQLNIKAALELDCPEFLRTKLEKREKETLKYINIEMMRDMLGRLDNDMMKFLNFDTKRNCQIPCVSQDVTVTDDKKVLAANDIKSGTMVVMEKAFVSVQDQYNEYTSCYYCHRMSLIFVPCEGCCKALFCTKECRDKCLEEYHRVECHIVAYMGSMYVRDVNKMAVRAAIKMSLKLSWEELRVASLEIGQKRLQKSSVKEAYDPASPVSLLCYDDQVSVDRKQMINASLICAAAVHCLSRVPEYMPEGETERNKAIDSLSRIMLHLNTTFLRKIAMNSSAYDYFNETYRCGAQRNEGWFAFSSKLTHCCEPNLLVVGFNDQVGLVAIKRIKKGDELTISFTELYFDLNLPPCPKSSFLRQKQIYNRIQYRCRCRACLQEWHSQSLVEGRLTATQKKAYTEYKKAMTKCSFKDQMKGMGAALDEFTDCANTVQLYTVYGDLRRTLNMVQCYHRLNKTYGSVSKYYFPIEE